MGIEEFMSLGLSYGRGASYARERLIISSSLSRPGDRRVEGEETASTGSWKPSSKTASAKRISESELLHRIMRFQRITGIDAYLVVLVATWIMAIYYMERSVPYSALARCKWSKHKDSEHNISRIALVADPQLVDDNTYPGRPKTLLSITKYVVDTYLRKSWVYMNKALDPDVILFLGDLFDGGRHWEDAQWHEEFDRFNKIFSRPAFKKTIMSLPGNHDIGYGDTIVKSALSRFQAFFGSTSGSIDIANHTVIWLDTISMMNTNDEAIYKPPLKFLEEFSKTMDLEKPRILLTHVPLFRPKGSNCGSDREHGEDLSYTKGFQYQTQITPEVTNNILEAIQPTVVFSGDDHDACHVQHSYYLNNRQYSADEYTVKSFSMAMGIASPGMQLLEIDGTPGLAAEDSYATSICLLPSPFAPFIVYGILAVISLAVILVFNFRPYYLSPLLRKLGAHSEETSESYLPLHKDKAFEKGTPNKRRARRTLMDVAVLVFVFFFMFIRLSNGIFSKQLSP